jgi:hypothetical protein
MKLRQLSGSRPLLSDDWLRVFEAAKDIFRTTNSWYSVAASQTPFYRHGPQQGNGPDMQLPRDSIMKVIRPSFGYVKVQLQDGENGYVGEMKTSVPLRRPSSPRSSRRRRNCRLPNCRRSGRTVSAQLR